MNKDIKSKTKNNECVSGNCNCNCNKNRKNEGSNDWNSVPVTYDKEESMIKHEKTATNNQWTSTSK